MEQPSEALCPQCHQPILPSYYFCPNCGFKLKQPPLATTLGSQLQVYVHSIVLPFLVFITIGKWQGMAYLRSEDPKARRIGALACILLALSTAFMVRYTIALTQTLLESITNGLNVDLGGY